MSQNNTRNVFERWELMFMESLGVAWDGTNLQVQSSLPLVWHELYSIGMYPKNYKVNYPHGTSIAVSDEIQVITEIPYEMDDSKTRSITVEKIDQLGNKNTYRITTEPRCEEISPLVTFLDSQKVIKRTLIISEPGEYYALSIVPKFSYHDDFVIESYNGNIKRPHRSLPFAMNFLSGAEFAEAFDRIVENTFPAEGIQKIMKAALPYFYKSFTDSIDRADSLKTSLLNSGCIPGANAAEEVQQRDERTKISYPRLYKPRKELDDYDPINRRVKPQQNTSGATK